MTSTPFETTRSPEMVAPCTLGQLTLYFLRLGTVGFGGPIALAGYMQKDLVEDRRWLSKEDYVEGLALAQLAPGPLAAQLASAAATGAIGGAAIVLGRRALYDIPTVLIALAALALLVRFKKVQEPLLIVAAGVVGVILAGVRQ